MFVEKPDWNSSETALVRLGEPEPSGDFEIGYLDLRGDHPTEALFGLVAPDEWWALGVIASGWMAPLEGEGLEFGTSTIRPSAHPDAVRVMTAAFVARDGTFVSRAEAADGYTIGHDAGEPIGIVPDALRRCFRLPTAAPTRPATEFFAALWLHLMNRTAGIDRHSWTKLAKRLPLTDVYGASLQNPDALASAAHEQYGALGWAGIKRWAERGTLGVFVPPDLAEWMDEGMLSRWLLASLPRPEHELGCLRERLSPEIFNKVERVASLLVGADAEDAAPGAVA